MAEKVERRLAAILSADVVGYGRLIAADEEGTLARLRDLRATLIDAKFSEHHGRIVKLMGDGVLVEFASVVDAVRCAVEIQREMAARNADISEDQRIVFRIGINLGDVVIEGDDIHGDGVNISARLEQISEPGGIMLSGTAYDQVRDRMGLSYEDIGEQTVKNIPRPVRAYRVVLDPSAAGETAALKRIKPGFSRRRRWAIPAAAAVAIIAIAAGVLLALEPWVTRVEQASIERMAFALPEKPSIAVLPFTNMSEDQEQEYFADGMTEDLITDLSKVSGLFVIARNTTFTYKGKAVKVRQVAEDLGVRYVLEGSVRRQGGRVRINAQLIDATGGHHIWSERYDRDAEDILTIQGEVAGEIVSALEVKLTVAEHAKLVQRPTASLEAYDLYLRGKQRLYRLTEKDLYDAIDLFQRAIARDPGYAEAWAGLAWAYTDLSTLGLSSSTTKRNDASLKAYEYGLRAMKIGAHLAEPFANYAVMLYKLSEDRQYERALQLTEKALSLDPNNPDILVRHAELVLNIGAPQQALDIMAEARRLNPAPPPSYALILAFIHFQLGQFGEAVEHAETFRKEVPESYAASWVLAPAYAYLGNQAAAKTHVDILAEQRTDVSLEVLNELLPSRERKDRGRTLEGFRRAGMQIMTFGAEPRGVRLTASEIESLLVGQTITSRDYSSGIQWWRRQEAGGSARRWDNEGHEATGSFTVEDDWACWEWDVADDFKRCSRVYRRSEGSAEGFDEYLMAGTGCVCTFGIEQPPLPLPDKPSIAVLPFTNLSGDEKQEYFVDGMTDTLITDLSSIPELFVIDRNTSFTYKGQAVDVKTVGRELGVKYVLEGSVQRAGGRVRINAQLIDATTGGHVWSERFDRANEDIFALQDEAIAKIIAALPIGAVQLHAGEAGQAPTESLEAYDLYLRGMQTIYNMNLPDLEQSIGLFDEALEIDPAFKLAHGARVWAYTQIHIWGLDTDHVWGVGGPFYDAANAIIVARRQGLDLAIAHAMRARLDTFQPKSPRVFTNALDEAEKAVLRAPGDPDVLASYAMVLSSSGEHERALSIMQDIYRRNPKLHPRFAIDMASIQFYLGRYDEAIENAAQFQREVPESYLGSWILAPALAFLGRTAEARTQLGILMDYRPDISLHKLDEFTNRAMKLGKDQGRLKEGLRLAGAPFYEGGTEPSGERLTKAEIETLLVGNTTTGRDYSSGIQWWRRQEADGSARRWDNDENEATGTFSVEDGWACWEWGVADEFKRCNRVYRRSEGSAEGFDEYLMAGTGCICAFRVEEQMSN